MVIWSEPAKTDLRSIHDFIARNPKHYAKKVVLNIREKADILDKLPKMGRIIPEIGDEKVREISLYSYRIIDAIGSLNIFVLAVVHKKRDLKTEEIGK